MNLRARLIWPFCGLLWLSVALPAAGAAPARAQASAPLQRFRFDAGAPLAAPAAVAPDGTVCVGTVDGYLHGLGPDGSFRWSRSVRGAVMRRPHFAGQRWFVATSAQRIYALNRDGSLSWVFKLYSPVATELASDESGTLYFVAADHFLYGLTARGAVTLRTPFRPGMKPELQFSAPAELRDPEGNDWRGRSDGVLEYRLAAFDTAGLLPLTSSALLLPAWSAASRSVVVSARSGLIFGLDLARIRPSR
ncbi:MAG TPA: PQQ-binding-like beta-propeller repeat protein [Polyangiaceae bacterium]|nr:PQQ-binding-like beta-propeller repeat protein [Polyangiaceae bacterium]